MAKQYWIKPPALKTLEDLSLSEALEVIRNLQLYIDDSLQRRDTFYDNLLLMKKESDENLKKLKMEFNKKMKDINEKNDKNDVNAEEEDKTPEDDLHDEKKNQEEVTQDVQKNTPEQRTTFITEVNLTYKAEKKPKASSDVMSGRTQKRRTDASLRALEKELLETKKELRELRKQYELARATKRFGKGFKKEASQGESVDKKQVDEIKELVVQIEVMKEKEKQMLEQMNILRDVIKEYEVKYKEKCLEVEHLKEMHEQQTPDKRVKTLKEEVDRLRLSEDELQKQIVQCERKAKERAEEIDGLRKQLRTTKNERDTQKINYEDSMVMLKDLQEEVRKLEATKRVTNERMRRMGGQVRITTSTQTYPNTIDAATNTENSIYNVYGRSLKQEDMQDDDGFLRSFYGNDLCKRKGFETPVRKSMLHEFKDFQSDFDQDKVWTPDVEEFCKAALEENLEVYQADSTNLLQDTDKISSEEEEILEALEVGIVNTVENERQVKFPQIPDGQALVHKNKDAKSNIYVKLPNISSPMGKLDAGRSEANRENTDEQRGDPRRPKHKKEQTPSKIDILMKEGNETQWRPITDDDPPAISPQKCPSSPILRNQATANFGKTKSDTDGMLKDMKLRAATNNKSEKNKREFMLIASGQCEGNKRN